MPLHCVLTVCCESLQFANEGAIPMRVEHNTNHERPVVTHQIFKSRRNDSTPYPSPNRSPHIRSEQHVLSYLLLHCAYLFNGIYNSCLVGHARLLECYPPKTPSRFLRPNHYCTPLLYRQILVRPLVRARLVARNLQSARQIRSNHRDVVRETRDRLEELL